VVRRSSAALCVSRAVPQVSMPRGTPTCAAAARTPSSPCICEGRSPSWFVPQPPERREGARAATHPRGASVPGPDVGPKCREGAGPQGPRAARPVPHRRLNNPGAQKARIGTVITDAPFARPTSTRPIRRWHHRKARREAGPTETPRRTDAPDDHEPATHPTYRNARAWA